MNKNDRRNLKNPKLARMFANEEKFFTMSEDEQARYITGLSVGGFAENTLCGYLDSFLNETEKTDLPLDFTYATFENLLARLLLQFEFYKTSYGYDEGKRVFLRTFAAYLYCLAMNEHGLELSMSRAPFYDELRNWAGYYKIKIGKDKKVDLLSAVLASVTDTAEFDDEEPLMHENAELLDVAPVIYSYKLATGVDLRDHKIMNAVLYKKPVSETDDE